MTYTRTRLLVASAAAAVAIAFRVISIVVEPAGSEGSSTELVKAAAAHPTASYLSTWSEMIAWSLAALACSTLIGLTRPARGRWLALVGGWLNTVASLGLGFGLTVAFAPVAVASTGAAARAVQAVYAINSSPALVPWVVLLSAGLLFPIIQGVGLALNGLIGWWYPAVTVVQAVAFVALGGEHALLLNLVGLVPLAVIWGAWAWMLHRAAETAAEPAFGAAPAAA